jgi:hypothetical protein
MFLYTPIEKRMQRIMEIAVPNTPSLFPDKNSNSQEMIIGQIKAKKKQISRGVIFFIKININKLMICYNCQKEIGL